MEFDSLDTLSVVLPMSERVGDDWVVDVEWLFTAGSEYAVGCVATEIRFVGGGFRACPQYVVESAGRVVKELWSRYQENIVGVGHVRG